MKMLQNNTGDLRYTKMTEKGQQLLQRTRAILQRDRVLQHLEQTNVLFESGCVLDSIQAIYSRQFNKPLSTGFLLRYHQEFPQAYLNVADLNDLCTLSRLLQSNLGISLNKMIISTELSWIKVGNKQEIPTEVSAIRSSVFINSLENELADEIPKIVILFSKDGEFHAVGVPGGDNSIAVNEIKKYTEGEYKDEHWQVGAYIEINIGQGE